MINLLYDAIEITKKILSPWIPRNLVIEELSGVYGNAILAEMGEIVKYYNIYENGANFLTAAEDYVPSQLRFKKIRTLIDKEARFMFANPLDIKISATNVEDNENPEISNIQNYVDQVLKHNHFDTGVLKGSKDCFIGKRIAMLWTFSEQYGIVLSIIPSLEFVYDTDNYGNLTKIITFYSTNTAVNSMDQRIQKKKYELKNGYCYISEGIYDGAGNLIETIIDEEATPFPYIPAAVILNDGLTGDLFGESEVANLYDYEQAYSKSANLDIDAEKKSMNPIYYSRDMTQNSTANLSLAPGALWDVHSDTEARDEAVGEVGILESNLNYSEPLNNTLNRIRDAMYEQLDMPSVNTSDLKGIVSSGKTFKAIYWGLIVRCDEKMKAWKYELEFLIKALIDGAQYYPEIAADYMDGKSFGNVDYTITIENTYPLPEDTAEEKQIDLMEVNYKTRSIKSYLRKWGKMTDKQVDEEIRQIALEKQMLEENYFDTGENNNPDTQYFNEDEENTDKADKDSE